MNEDTTLEFRLNELIAHLKSMQSCLFGKPPTLLPFFTVPACLTSTAVFAALKNYGIETEASNSTHIKIGCTAGSLFALCYFFTYVKERSSKIKTTITKLENILENIPDVEEGWRQDVDLDRFKNDNQANLSAHQNIQQLFSSFTFAMTTFVFFSLLDVNEKYTLLTFGVILAIVGGCFIQPILSTLGLKEEKKLLNIIREASYYEATLRFVSTRQALRDEDEYTPLL